MTPQQIQAQYARATQQIAKGQLTPAETTLKALLIPSKGAAEVHYQLSRIAEVRGDSQAQATALDRALEKRPSEKALLEAAVQVNTRLGKTDAVLALYDRLIALEPNAVKPRADKAVYLQNLGRFDAAERILRFLIKKKPKDGELYRMLAGGYTFKRSDPLLAQMHSLWRDEEQTDTSHMNLGFALAKAMEETGARDRVFGYLDSANALQRRLAPFDTQARDAEWQAFLDAQETDDYSPVGQPTAPRAVFVTGMPRSGTTLVEQIIASHSAACAGGELGHSLQQAVTHFGAAHQMQPLAKISAMKLARWAEGYARLVRRDTGAESGVVTDKSIQTHMIFGLIARGMPGARLIVVHRDPRDMALSIYKNHFKLGTHRYANALADIADAIKMFRASVAHWKARLPDRIHEVRYEELVADPEPQARALVAAAGLEWEDACLDFHKSKAEIRTLSLMQVRQPIHAGRREAWRKYEAELQPFIDAWGDEPWD